MRRIELKPKCEIRPLAGVWDVIRTFDNVDECDVDKLHRLLGTKMSGVNGKLASMTQGQLENTEKALLATFPNLGQISPIRLLGEGWGSVAVVTSNQLVFRIAKNEIFAEQHSKQVKILPLVARTLPISVPIPEYYSEPSDSFPMGVMGYKKIAGTVLSHSQVTTDTGVLANDVAEFLLAIHSMNPPIEIRDIDYPGAPDQEQPLGDVWKQVTGWLREELSASDFDLVTSQWQDILSLSGQSAHQPVLVHGDPWYGNLLLDESGRLVGVVDFDKLHVGDSVIDFGVQEYASANFMNDVIRRYRELGGNPGENLEQRIKIAMQTRISHLHPHSLS